MEMESIFGRMDQLMMENLIQVFVKGMGNGDLVRILKNAMNMRVLIRTIKRMGMENIFGLIDHSMKDISRMI